MTLHFYVARKFIVAFLLIFTVFLGIVLLIDMMEQIRKFSGTDVTVRQALNLALLNAPSTLLRVLPLLTLLATLSLFLGLARTSELVVTRAAGRSALRSLIAPASVALMLGVFAVAIWNPLAAATSKRAKELSNRYSQGSENVLSVSAEGLWLRQANEFGTSVIHAKSTNLDGTELFDATFLDIDLDGRFISRRNAQSAVLGDGYWILNNGKEWRLTDPNPEVSAETFASLEIASSLTHEEIRESFDAPSSVPIWELPGFIRRLETAGFAPLAHKVWFWMEISSPALLVAMVLIGAGFTMRHTRFGGIGIMILFALSMGFGIFFLRNFAQVLGTNGQIPVLLAAWSPPLAGVLMSLGLLFHTEDG